MGEHALDRVADEFITEAARLGTWVWDRSTDRVRWNRHHETLLGYAPGTSERTYQEWAARVHPDDLARVEAELQGALATARLYDSSYRVVHPDGSVRTLRGRGGIVPGQTDIVAGALWDVTDVVTARQQAESLATMLETAQGLASVGVVVFDPGTREAWHSREIARIYGHPPDARLSLAQAAAQLHPDDRDRQLGVLHSLLKGEVTPPSGFRIVRPDGEVRHLRDAATTLASDGGRRVVTALWDVSDQVRADQARANTERALRTLSRGHDAMFRAGDPHSLITSLCEAIVDEGGFAFAQYVHLGVHPGSAKLGAWAGAPRFSLVAAAVEDESAWLEELFERAEQPYARIDLVHPQAPPGWAMAAQRIGLASWMALPVPGSNAAPGALVVAAAEAGVFDDGTVGPLADLADAAGFGLERLSGAVALLGAQEAARDAEHERLGLLERLVALGQEERARLAVALHDDPVQRATAALLFLDAVEAGGVAEPVRAHLESARGLLREQVRSLRGLLFELAPPEIEAGGLATTLTDAAEHLFAETATALTVRVEVDVEPPPATSVHLYRIGLEALGNVKRHAAAGQVSLTLRSSPAGIRLEVVDDGIGFDASRREFGHLGLRAMRDRAEALGATFELSTAEGAGTRLVVEVQLSK